MLQLAEWGPFDMLIGGSPCNDLTTVSNAASDGGTTSAGETWEPDLPSLPHETAAKRCTEATTHQPQDGLQVCVTV